MFAKERNLREFFPSCAFFIFKSISLHRGEETSVDSGPPHLHPEASSSTFVARNRGALRFSSSYQRSRIMLFPRFIHKCVASFVHAPSGGTRSGSPPPHQWPELVTISAHAAKNTRFLQNSLRTSHERTLGRRSCWIVLRPSVLRPRMKIRKRDPLIEISLGTGPRQQGAQSLEEPRGECTTQVRPTEG